jgi:hypothetical protein
MGLYRDRAPKSCDQKQEHGSQRPSGVAETFLAGVGAFSACQIARNRTKPETARASAIDMSSRQLFVPLGDADTLVQKLLDVGNSLKPIDDTNYYFFEIVRELVDGAIKNFTELRRGYVAGNLNLIAWDFAQSA